MTTRFKQCENSCHGVCCGKNLRLSGSIIVIKIRIFLFLKKRWTCSCCQADSSSSHRKVSHHDYAR